jgi:hypothetical protein
MTHILQYTALDLRGCVHEGTFREISSKEFKIGDFFLTHHIDAYTNKPILEKVKDMRIAMYFQNEPIYDLFTNGRGCYKSNLKLVSIYDRLISHVPVNKCHIFTY